MSHDQRHRPQADDKLPQLQPIKYGDVFKVSGELASKPIPPEDAAAMQIAATLNQAAGAVSRDDITDIARNQGVSRHVDREGSGQRVEPDVPTIPTDLGWAAIVEEPITIGEVLEVVAIAAGDKPVGQSDAAAITAAEIRAAGRSEKTPIGLGATAQAAATLNTHAMCREEMTKLSNVLTDATVRLENDKVVTGEDAEAVYAAEKPFPWRRDKPETMAEPGGVATLMATAARLNQKKLN